MPEEKEKKAPEVRPLLAFPPTMTAEQIIHTRNEKYLPDLYATQEDFFHNERFMEAKKKYLIPRQIEQTIANADFTKDSTFKARLAYAAYTNHYAGVLRMWADAITIDTPVITGSPRLNYLNVHLSELVHEIAIDTILHGHSWLRICWDEEILEEGVLKSLPNIEEIDPADVDDWLAEGEVLQYVRTYSDRAKRPSIFSPPDMKVQEAIYYTDGQTAVYRRILKTDSDGALPFSLVEVDEHDDPLPFILVDLPHGLNLGVVLLDPAKILFNIEANLLWLLNMQAYAQLWISSDHTNFANMIRSEMSCIQVEKGGNVGFAQPAADAAVALEARIEQIKLNMYQLAQESALIAVQANANASGESKKQDYRALEIPLRFIGAAIKRNLQYAIDLIADKIGCPHGTVEGLEEFVLEGLDGEGDEPDEPGKQEGDEDAGSKRADAGKPPAEVE